MKVLVDTCVWSQVLRREHGRSNRESEELKRLVSSHRVQIIGPIRQELLSGIRRDDQFRLIEERLAAFPDFPIGTEDYVAAARFFNTCRANGVQGSNTDFLVCAVAQRNGMAIFSTDNDFTLFAKYLPIRLHVGK